MSDSDHEDGDNDEGNEQVANTVKGNDVPIDSVEAEIQRAESADFEVVDAPSSDSARVIHNQVLGFGRCAQVHLRAMGRRGARGVQSSDRLSGGHLEAGRPVPTTCAHGRFMLCCMCRRRSRPSVGDIGRRRSVRCGGHAHTCTSAHAQAYTYASFDSHAHAVPCTHDACDDEHRATYFVRRTGLKPAKTICCKSIPAPARAYARACAVTRAHVHGVSTAWPKPPIEWWWLDRVSSIA